MIKSGFSTLPPKAILEFKKIFKDKYDIDLRNEEATEKANQVFRFVKIIGKKSFVAKEVKM